MRKTIALLALLVAAGCAGASAPKKEDPSSEERSRSTLQVRKELKEIEGELDRLRRDREGWNAIEEDSAEKREALAKMDVWEKKWQDRRKQLLDALDVADGSGEPEEVPETDAFAALFDAEVATEEQEEEAAEMSEEELRLKEKEEQKAREEEEARRTLEEEEKRREEEWARRRAEADALRAAAAAQPEEGGEKQLFHEKWSQVILAIQQQLQRYKRW